MAFNLGGDPSCCYWSLYTRGDALFELTGAVLCADGPVKSLVELRPAAEHRRGAMYDAVDHGRLEPGRPRGLPVSMRSSHPADSLWPGRPDRMLIGANSPQK
ncbi:hypothetical protein [Streptomyces sp. HPF1205]|uniref:hypothetical protein n=1 Tax=Streptomyces sp. HPF1205 TaxID=2873262 RepID=UPI0035AC295A